MINSMGEEEDASWHLDAAKALRKSLAERGELANLRIAVRSVEFWRGMHFQTGLYIRNMLRSLNFGEIEYHILNLDDHYVPIMLLAVGYEIAGGYNPWAAPETIVNALVPVVR